MGNRYDFKDYELAPVLDKLKKHVGAGNPIKSKDLCSKPIKARLMVHALRVKGYPICSGRDGYYMAKTSEELAGTIKYIKAIADEQYRTLQGLQKCYNNYKLKEAGLNE